MSKDIIRDHARETAIVTTASLAILPFTYPLETLKIQKQRFPQFSYYSIGIDLLGEGGAARFYQGFSAYFVRQTICGIAGSFGLVASIKYFADTEQPSIKNTAAIALSAGTIEALFTLPVETIELKHKTSNYELAATHLLKQGLRSLPPVVVRNSIYAAGIAIPYMNNSNPTETFAYGLGAGLASIPADVITTQSFAFRENPLKTVARIMDGSPLTAMKGSLMRGLQIGMFSSIINTALKYNKERSIT